MSVRVTRIYSTIRTAQMSARVARREGFKYTRIDTVPNPGENDPRFLILASQEPLDNVPHAWDQIAPLPAPAWGQVWGSNT